jgi:hypothetical protein
MGLSLVGVAQQAEQPSRTSRTGPDLARCPRSRRISAHIRHSAGKSLDADVLSG